MWRLYGRKINNAEHQLSFVKYLRAVADDELKPVEAVRAYHGDLQQLRIPPHRSLQEDLQSTEMSGSYAGTTAKRTTAASRPGLFTLRRGRTGF